MELNSDLHDDPNIPNDEPLYRAIHPNNLPGGNISSSTFISRSDPHTSVDRSSLCTPQQTLQRFPHYAGVAELLTRTVREWTPGVASAPEPENPAHALILRDLSLSNAKWKEVARKLAKACKWIILPSIPSPPT
ncbi:MAG: hypothetical protein WC975_07375 [Phycisphaerae bacterium]